MGEMSVQVSWRNIQLEAQKADIEMHYKNGLCG